MPTCVTYCRDTALPVGLDLMISRGPFQLLHFHDSITYFEQIKNKTKQTSKKKPKKQKQNFFQSFFHVSEHFFLTSPEDSPNRPCFL